MDKIQIKKNNKLLEQARELRRAMTPQERHLWYDYLQQYPVKIYKQRIIDNFIVDFYCHKARLITEVDGAGHYTHEGWTYDLARTKALENYGLHVMRISDREVEEQFDRVCQKIDDAIKMRIHGEM